MTDSDSILAIHEIVSIEGLLEERHLMASLSVHTVRRLCGAARRAVAREHTPAEVELRKIVDIVFSDENGLRAWKHEAPLGAEDIGNEIARALRSVMSHSNSLAGLLNGPAGARQRAEDAEAAARLAWRDRSRLERDLAMLLRMLEAVRLEETTLEGFAISDFHFHREALTFRYRELKGGDGKWKDGRGDVQSSTEATE